MPIETLARDLSYFSEDQCRRIIEAYMHQTKSSELPEGIPCIFHDPIDDDPAYKGIIEAARTEAEKKFPNKLGRCNYIWCYMQEILLQQGIDWLSPADMNPHIRFD